MFYIRYSFDFRFGLYVSCDFSILHQSPITVTADTISFSFVYLYNQLLHCLQFLLTEPAPVPSNGGSRPKAPLQEAWVH